MAAARCPECGNPVTDGSAFSSTVSVPQRFHPSRNTPQTVTWHAECRELAERAVRKIRDDADADRRAMCEALDGLKLGH